MRLSPLAAAASILLLSGPAAAQGWIEYVNQEDRFIVNFPGQPTARAITYPTEFGITLPARVYSVENGPDRYSVTVVDYSPGEQTHTDRVRNCKGYPDTCGNRWMNDLRGALDYAVSKFIQRDGKVTYYAFGDSDRVEGRRLQLINADDSRTFVAIYMHQNHLYILDGTVSASSPPPALFQQNFGFFDKDGVRVRYRTLYSNLYPPPLREETRGRLNGC
ncbi:MAG: hypothetical protein ACRD3C_24125 [Vicinamibacterales bacterium]